MENVIERKTKMIELDFSDLTTVTFVVPLPAISNSRRNLTPTASPTTPTARMQVTTSDEILKKRANFE